MISKYIDLMDRIQNNLDKFPRELWDIRTLSQPVLWIINMYESDGYSGSGERLGIMADKQIVYGYQSHCSCYGIWENADSDYRHETTFKAFTVDIINFEFGDDSCKEIEDFWVLLNPNPTLEQILQVNNQERRQILLKRIDFAMIERELEFIHQDEFGTLYNFPALAEKFVRVKDASTDRYYMLAVPYACVTAKGAIAWTFGLTEGEYNPIIET